MHRTMAAIVRAHALGTPEKCAVTDGRCAIRYGELERASLRFAGRLREAGCRPGDRAVILAHKNATLLVAVLGALKSGVVYVPLDPASPAKRLRFLFEDLTPKVVLSDPELLPLIEEDGPPGIEMISTRELRELLDEERSAREPSYEPLTPLPEIRSDDVAYCICTSGSTGRPKGVLIRQKSILAFFEGMKEVYDVTRDSRCVSFSPLHFDGSLIDVLYPLYRGASVYLYSDVVDPDLLFAAIEDHAATHFAAFGAMLDVIALASQFEETPLPELRTVLTGAHAPAVATVQNWLRKTSGGKVINAYGPTEATCACAAYVIRELEPDRRTPYPIGKPLKEARLLLVDEENQAIEGPNRPGELWIGGPQVMKSYWHREEENRSRLVVRDGETYYRTGDLCQYLDDGNLLFLGRNDSEVNIGGYRVNLNEVKRAIENVHGVHGSEVVKTDSQHGEPILLAAVVLGNHGPSRDREIHLLRGRLAEELPSYMVPRHLVALDEFPRLMSGKIDRRALESILQNAT